MEIKNFFQKGYYINLDRRTDRNETFIEEVKKYNLENFFERVSAEDGINEPNALKRHSYCSLTYHKLFQKIYDQGYDNVLIFEDDATFYTRFGSPIEMIENAIDELNNFPDWNLIYFGGCPLYKMEIVSKSLAKIDWVLGTHAVGYKRETIKYVLDNYVPFGDGAIDAWYANSPSLKKYITVQPIIYQGPSKSDLDAHGHINNEYDYIRCYEKVEKIYTYNENN